MMINAGFAADFAEFRRRGEIGPTALLRISPAEPEIGQTFEVAASGVFGATLRCITTGETWSAERGGRRFVATLTQHFALLDPSGRVLASQTVEPWFDEPVVDSWELPPQLVWCESPWVIPLPVTRGVAELRLSWQEHGQAVWQPVRPGVPLAIPARRCRIVLRAEVRSRHAAFTPRATVTVQRDLMVVPPAPALLDAPDSDTVLCHTPSVLSFQLRHVRAARLFIGDVLVATSDANPQGVLRIDHALLPARCERLTMRLEAVDVEGQPRSILTRLLVVVPRPVRVRTHPVAEQSDAFHVVVDGGTLEAIAVPHERWRCRIAGPEALVTLQRHSATLALLEVRDDAGDIALRRLLLSPQSFEWSALPHFSTAAPPEGW